MTECAICPFCNRKEWQNRQIALMQQALRSVRLRGRLKQDKKEDQCWREGSYPKNIPDRSPKIR